LPWSCRTTLILKIVEEAKTSIVKQREYIYYAEHAVTLVLKMELYLLKATRTYKGKEKTALFTTRPQPKKKEKMQETSP